MTTRSPNLARLAALLLAFAAACAQKRWEPPPCPSGQQRCGGGCVDVQTSLRNCGACGNACLVNSTCTGGVCSACPADRPDACGSVGAGGVCTNLQTGVDGYCGTCGLSCAATGVAGTDATCAAGACVCSGAAIDCGGNPRCVNAQTDPANCGGCGNACAGGRTCASGACACPAAKPTPCGTGDGTCTNTQTDVANCGSCGNACPLAGEICAAGACACPSTAPDQCAGPGRCVNLDTDAKNCGACGFACPVAGEICAGGKCGCPASAPTNCGDVCTRTADDEKNCGTCGNVCAAGRVCSAGVCTGCPTATPNACGTQCCASPLCCNGGTSCATARSNGLGQTFYSCDPPGTWSATSAEQAAQAWPVTAVATFDQSCSGSCLAVQTASQCAVWCFDGNFQGQVSFDKDSIVCTCPPGPGVISSW